MGQFFNESLSSHDSHNSHISHSTDHHRQLKDQLPHTWDAMFARFGRFTEIQAQAIEPLLAGRNCVLVAATASGKTEAALAPLIERHKHDKSFAQKLSLLYLVPTRALARDLARRLRHRSKNSRSTCASKPVTNLRSTPTVRRRC